MAGELESADVTVLLTRLKEGDRAAYDELMPTVYDQLRRIARRQISRLGGSETLSTTALVNEAFLKLSESRSQSWEDRVHFFAVAANAMRHILVDYARKRNALKRGGPQRPLSLDDAQVAIKDQAETVVILDDALTKLAKLNPRLTQVVECRFFGGLTENETASALGVTARTVRRDWVKARAWLYREMKVDPE